MKIEIAYKSLLESLEEITNIREASNICNNYFEDAFGIQKAASSQETLNNGQIRRFDLDLKRLVSGEPIQYVTGKAFFYGYEFKVDPSVLIPRPETEELVYWMEKDLSSFKPGLRILDIGTGSGCIAICLKKKLPQFEVLGLDISEQSLKCAKNNAENLKTEVLFLNVDFLDENQWEKIPDVDIIVSNPPYVISAELSSEDEQRLSAEPVRAIYVLGKDAMVFYRKIIEFGLSTKKAKTLYFEINEFRKLELEKLVVSYDVNYEFKKDLQGKFRMLKITF